MKHLLLILSLTVVETLSGSTEFDFFGSPPSLLSRAAADNSEIADSPCTTPNKVPGTCVSIFKCEKLFSLYSRAATITANEKKSVQDAFCGWNMGAPHVCCENAVARNLPTEQCGNNPLHKNSVRIIGGGNSTLGSWPWMAALYLRNTYTGTTRFGCGGSLIAGNWVLTAAHCIPQSKSETLDHVRLGDLDIDPKVADGASPIEIKIKEVIKHPNYSKKPVLNDIALLRLEESVKYSQYVAPICLHSGEKYISNETIYEKKKPVVAGWGDTAFRSQSTTHLMEVELNIVSYTKCDQSYAEFIQSGEVKLDKTVLCSYAPKKDSCQGDSGGPLMFIETGGLWSQGGIVSFGYECAKEGYPGVYTKVAAFIDWINQSTGLKF